MRLNKRVFILTLTTVLVCAAVFCPESVFAAASVSLTAGGNWALNYKGASTATTSSSYTVTNDNSGGTEDIRISVGNSASCTPSASVSPGNNQFVLQLTNAAGAVITGTPATLVSGLTNNVTSSFTLYFTTPTAGSTGEGTQQSITVTLTATNWVWVCGGNLTVTHTAGDGVAPVSKTVTYGTVSSTLTGSTKCWITQNLGADHQASAVNDSTEASAGWYWQFNRKQGYKHDGTTRTPSTTWITSISETANWATANDPCALLLGTGWRLPTSTEWTNADSTGGWTNYTQTYASVLKLHAAGELNAAAGLLNSRGSYAYYWSGTQNVTTNSWLLWFYSSSSTVDTSNKANGMSVRCLKD